MCHKNATYILVMLADFPLTHGGSHVSDGRPRTMGTGSLAPFVTGHNLDVQPFAKAAPAVHV